MFSSFLFVKVYVTLREKARVKGEKMEEQECIAQKLLLFTAIDIMIITYRNEGILLGLRKQNCLKWIARKQEVKNKSKSKNEDKN